LIDDLKDPHEAAQEQLNKYVNGIDDQFNNVLARHENDFVNAYRVSLKRKLTLCFIESHGQSAEGIDVSKAESQ
jgi:hypothetical protein